MRNFYSGMPMANVFGKVPILAMPKYMTKAGQIFKQGYKMDTYIKKLSLQAYLTMFGLNKNTKYTRQ